MYHTLVIRAVDLFSNKRYEFHVILDDDRFLSNLKEVVKFFDTLPLKLSNVLFPDFREVDF